MSVGGDEQILAGIEQVARRHLRWAGKLAGGERLVDALRLDSLRLLTLVVELENHFRICLDVDAEGHGAGAAGIETVRDLVEAIRSKLGALPHAE